MREREKKALDSLLAVLHLSTRSLFVLSLLLLRTIAHRTWTFAAEKGPLSLFASTWLSSQSIFS